MTVLKVLSKKETTKVLNMEDVIRVVESAYVQKASDNAKIFDWVFNAFNPGVADMDIKSGWLKNDNIFGMKMVSWFSENAQKKLPVIHGVIMVFDDETGAPIGLVDGDHITGMRTGASGAIGAKYSARKDASTLLMVGTGHIAKFEIAATLTALKSIDKVLIDDPRHEDKAVELASTIKDILKNEFKITRPIEVIAISDRQNAVSQSDVIITATPSQEPLIKKEWLKQGTHISCVGADMPGKEEIDPNIFKDARVFVDDIEQCKNIGEIEIPIKLGVLKEDQIAGEIGDIINGQVPGRCNDKEITVFDATGTALLDLVTAQLAFKEAGKLGIGASVEL